MDSEKARSFRELVRIGRVFLSKEVFSHLEAFSGNALYYGRGMPMTSKYKTVKEVCDLTGLTRKHLYYFHHEKVVQAVAYANYSVEGHDGYKLYDEAAVEKLQQIALYYQLGLKRDEIRDIMLDPNYDSNLVLDTLMAMERAKKARIKRHIAALEYLKRTGTKNRLLTPLRGMTLEELGEAALTVSDKSPPVWKQSFMEEFRRLCAALQANNATESEDSGDKIIGEIFALSEKEFGKEGVLFVLGYFVSSIGCGSTARQLCLEISPEQGKRVIRYAIKHPELYQSISGNFD